MALTRPRAAQIYDIDYKQATRVVTVSNITLAGGAPSLVDGVTLSVNDRVLVTGQSTASQNGVYFVSVLGTGSSGTWLRTTDTNSTGELLAGTIIMVTEGVTYADTQWKLITDNPITIGVTALTFVQNYSANSISAGTSNVVVTSNANVTISSAGTANVLTVSDTGAYVAGVVSATGNVTGSYIIGNGSQLTGLPAGYSNADVANYLASGTVTTDIKTTADISATGNITGNYILGNGSQLTGLPAGYANSNAVAYGETGWSGNIIPGSNAVYTLGNATNQWKSLYVSNTTIYIGDVPLSTEGNTLTVAGNAVLTTASGNANITGNITATGYVSATGNITGNYIIGNGSQLTGLPAGYGNANLADIGSNSISTTGNISSGYFIGNGSTLSSVAGANVTGTVANATYATSAGTAGTVTTAAQPNITSVGTLSSVSVSGNAVAGNFNTAGDVSATGNVYGNNIITAGGSGGNISGVNVLTANTVNGGTISASGSITGGNIYTGGLSLTGNSILATGATIIIDPNGSGGTDGNVVIAGNLSVQGNVTYIDSNVVTTNEKSITLANNVSTGIAADGAGIDIGNNTLAYWRFNNASTSWQSNIGITPAANAQLNLGGTTNYWANVYATEVSVTGNVSSGNLSTTGNVTGNYILGNGSQLTGISTTAFKTISVSGESNVSAADTPNIAFVAGSDISITTDAANGTITFNYASSSSIFATGGDMGLVTQSVTSSEDLGSVVDVATVFYDLGSVANDGSYTTLSVTGNTTTGNLLTGGVVSATGNILTGGIVSATGNVAGNYFIGNGSQLTGISSGNSSIIITQQTITANFTIASGQNGLSVGPMITADNVQVSVADGQRWIIL